MKIKYLIIIYKMDFQSRINQFRQGLSDQQDSYNRAMGNLGQMGRTLIPNAPDRVAEHYAYMEKVGGMTTGASAGIHTVKNLGKRMLKARQQKQGQQNNKPQEDNKSQEDKIDDQSSLKEESQGEREIPKEVVQETSPEQKELLSTGRIEESFKGASGGKTGISARRTDQEELSGEDIKGTGGGGGMGEENPFESDPATGKVGDAPLKQLDTSGGSTTDVSEIEPAKGPPIGGSTPDELEEGAKAFKGNLGTASDDTASFASKASDLADTAGNVVKSAASKAVDAVGDITLEGVADAVPVLGELVGLGMLIHGIVKAHKHEENAGSPAAPQLTATQGETSETAGGFDSGMLKMNDAPSIY